MSKIKELIDKEINKSFGKNYKLIQELVSPAIGIKLRRKTDTDQAIDIDTDLIKSKIGGFPDIDSDFIWPDYNELPLTFLCQINLSETSKFNLELPSNGILYFFVASWQSENYVQLINEIKVVYKESNYIQNKLSKLGLEQVEEYLIQFYEHYSVPSYQEKVITDNRFFEQISDELDELETYLSELTYGDEDYTKHHILGDPNAVQGAVRMYWGASVLHPEDIYHEKMPEYIDRAQEIGSDFILLLQIDLCDSLINLPNYGDNCLYFGILRNDLKNKDFSNVKLVIQNT